MFANLFLSAQTITISPDADTYVRNGTYGNDNYGTENTILVKGSSSNGYTKLAYLKFSLGDILNVKSAKIRLYGSNIDNSNVVSLSVFSISDDSWTETGINFNNAPTSTTSISSTAVSNVQNYYEFDVTNFVANQLSGDRIVSVYLKDAANKVSTLSFNTKENGQNPPELVVDTTTDSAPQPSVLTLSPTEDAYVRNGTYGNTNYGSETSLVVKGSASSGYKRSSYLQFNLASALNVKSAKLRLYGSNIDNTSTVNVGLFGVDNDGWDESTLTFNNAPPGSSKSLTSLNVNSQASYYEFDATDFVKAQFSGDKVVSFLLNDTTNKVLTIQFNSKENSQNTPQLIIDTTGGSTPPPPSSNASLFVENLDKFPDNDHFMFSHIQIPWTRDTVYNANHDSLKIRIHNNGSDPLIISNFKISTETIFKIDKFNGIAYNPSTQLPATIPVGGVLDLIVKEVAKDLATRAKVLSETLTITSNDGASSTKIVYLGGLWQKSGEGSHEPYAQEIITAFGYKTKTGFNATDPDHGDSSKLKGDEIRPSYFLRANNNIPVTVQQLAAYHGCCHSPEAFKWFNKGTTTYTTIFTHVALDGQSLLPRKSISSGALANGTFTPTSTPFGFIIGSTNSTAPARNPGFKLGIRVWKAIDALGNIIPNTYILGNDYLGTTATNYDFNDNLYLVSNVRPYIGAAFYSTLNVSPSDLDFGEHLVQTKDSLQLNISSGGQVYSDGSQDPPIVISSVAVIGENQSEFSASLPLKTTLNPQEATTIKVKFNPTSQGLKIADLLIYYNNSQSPKRVPLYGIAKNQGVTVIADYRINAGSPSSTTINGQTWEADNKYSFDNLEPYRNPALTEITATDKDALYFYEQSSNGDKKPFRYEFPILKNGDYYVRLHFGEVYWGVLGSGSAGGPGSRVMSVKIENSSKLINYDIAQDVGSGSAVIKNFLVTVNDGKLNIDFSATVNRPSVSAIEVYEFSSPSGRPAITTAVQNNFVQPSVPQNFSYFDFAKPRIYPNPLQSKRLNIEFPAKYQGDYNLNLIDIMGRNYYLGKAKLKTGGSNMPVDIPSLSLKPGVYFLKISSSSNSDLLKLLIE